jgi:hypothetical protein
MVAGEIVCCLDRQLLHCFLHKVFLVSKSLSATSADSVPVSRQQRDHRQDVEKMAGLRCKDLLALPVDCAIGVERWPDDRNGPRNDCRNANQSVASYDTPIM